MAGPRKAVAGGAYNDWIFIAGGGSIVSDPQVVLTDSGLMARYVTATDGEVWGTNQTSPGGPWADWVLI